MNISLVDLHSLPSGNIGVQEVMIVQTFRLSAMPRVCPHPTPGFHYCSDVYSVATKRRMIGLEWWEAIRDASPSVWTVSGVLPTLPGLMPRRQIRQAPRRSGVLLLPPLYLLIIITAWIFNVDVGWRVLGSHLTEEERLIRPFIFFVRVMRVGLKV